MKFVDNTFFPPNIHYNLFKWDNQPFPEELHIMLNRRTLVIGILILIAALAAGGYWRLMPKVTSILPAANAADIFTDSPIQITFSTAIRPDGIERYLRIEPNTTGIYQVIDNTLVFTPSIPWAQDTDVKVTVLPGIKSTLGLSLVTGRSWSFTTRHPWLFYLMDTVDRTDLYSIDPSGLDTQKVLPNGDPVLDYDIGSDHTVYYSTDTSGGGTLIRKADLVSQSTTDLVTCPNAVCTQLHISPDEGILVYHSVDLSTSTVKKKPALWMQKITNGLPDGKAQPVGIVGHVTRDPSWSTGGWLAFYDETSAAFQFYYPPDGKRVSFVNGTGEPGSWSADGKNYAAPDINYNNTLSGAPIYFSQIISYNPQTGDRTEMTRDNRMEDLMPTFSPDGTQLVFARRYLNPENWTPGRQVWAMNVDGSNIRPLTDSPVDNHLGFAWSPAGDMLAYLQFNTASLTGKRGLWLMDMSTGTTSQILVDAYNLQWLP